MNPSSLSPRSDTNKRPSRLDEISTQFRRTSTSRRNSVGYATNIENNLERAKTSRSKSSGFSQETADSTVKSGNPAKKPTGSKSLDFPEDMMRSIIRRRMDRTLHLADNSTKPRDHSPVKPSCITTQFRSRSTGHDVSPKKPNSIHWQSRRRSTGYESNFPAPQPDLFSVRERPDEEETGEEQDTPKILVFKRRGPSSRASTRLDW